MTKPDHIERLRETLADVHLSYDITWLLLDVAEAAERYWHSAIVDRDWHERRMELHSTLAALRGATSPPSGPEEPA